MKLAGNAHAFYKSLRTDALKARLSNDSNADNQSENSLVSEGSITPVGPAAAAAIASSLYGSGAPYLHARVRARQELASLIRVPAPKLQTNERLSEIDSAIVPEVSADDNEHKSPTSQKSEFQSSQTRTGQKVTGTIMLKPNDSEEKSSDEKNSFLKITKTTASVFVVPVTITSINTGKRTLTTQTSQAAGDTTSNIPEKSKINYV
ncbi:unnamed protein product [Trichobilharzia regenti]|nr:unnamed protein product [Trichobilharzia regenti]